MVTVIRASAKSMKNIERKRDEQKAGLNPGHELGTFLLGHSNSPEYLVSQLEGYLEAARADLEAERATFRKLFNNFKAQ